MAQHCTLSASLDGELDSVSSPLLGEVERHAHPTLQVLAACEKNLYWVVQVGLLTPLTFAQHRLSLLAAFTSNAYFLHNGRW